VLITSFLNNILLKASPHKKND